MADTSTSDLALSTALQKRRELQDTIRRALRDLDEIETMLRLFRKYSTASERGASLEDIETGDPALGKAGRGLAQPVFENLVKEILRDRGEPMQSQELLDEFHKRGHAPGGTNESKTMYNRLWQAKSKGALVHFPKPGYWLADEPIPETASVRAQSAMDAERVARGEPTRQFKKKPPGRKKIFWDDAQVQTAKKMAREGKSVKQICAALGGMSPPNFYLRFKGGIAGLLKEDETQTEQKDLLS